MAQDRTVAELEHFLTERSGVESGDATGRVVWEDLRACGEATRTDREDER